jgi:CRISPR-associated protein Cmr3
MIQLAFRPLEPLRFGLRNLGGVDVFGVDEVAYIPPPTAVLGALGALLGLGADVDCAWRDGYDFSDLKSLVKKMADADLTLATRSNEPVLWGPLLSIRGEHLLPVGEYALPVSLAGEYVKKAVEYYEGKEDAAKEAANLLCRMAAASERIGVQLDVGKTVRYMYRAKYVAYVDDVEMLFRAKLVGKLDRAVVRLGGEGRLAAVEAREEGALPAGSQRGEYAIALQPVLIYSDKPVAKVDGVAGLDCVEEVYGVLEEDRFKVKVVDFGLGFSEVCRRRRPMLKALPQGTVLRLKSSCGDAAAIGILSEIGFGSLYKV